MCGIAGILNFNGRSVMHSHIKSMTDALLHRGPDGEGQWIDNNIGLGHRRLAIIDLSSAGHQPMQTIDGRYVLTYNGEVYNFKKLRTELESLGYKFYSNTDSEVILNAYVEWKEKCVEKFNGMFAFAIWDKKNQKLFLARDRYGIKPLYYYQTDKFICFASEIKAILKSSICRSSLDKEALVEYLTFQNFFSDKTIFQNVKILMPGHFAYIEPLGNIKFKKYWDFKFTSDLKISEEEAIRETDRLFNQAVARQLVSDVPVNSYLSGGIDSGAITMVASKLLSTIKTFTIGFDLSSASGLELAFDERVKAERISYLAQTEHYEMVLKAGDMERCLENYVWQLEEPRVGQSYPNYYAAKLASKFGKVVLSGCGGDELFGGYPWRYFKSEGEIKFNDFVDNFYLKWHRLVPNKKIKELLHPIWDDVKHVCTKNIFANVFPKKMQCKLNAEEAFNSSLYFEAKTFLHGLLVVEDKLSMAHSLESRVPFLDNDLVDFAIQLPSNFKVKKIIPVVDENELGKKRQHTKDGKYILRKALSRYLGDEIAMDNKQGFSSPDASWFRGESIEYIKKILSKANKIFSQKIIQNILKEHVSGEKNNRLAIWSLLYLEKHFEKFFTEKKSFKITGDS